MGVFKKKKAPVQELDNTEQKNVEKNEALGEGRHVAHFDQVERKKGETQAQYNERVPVAFQPPTNGPTHSYLGKPL